MVKGGLSQQAKYLRRWRKQHPGYHSAWQRDKRAGIVRPRKVKVGSKAGHRDMLGVRVGFEYFGRPAKERK